jgi:hypothetical protein
VSVDGTAEATGLPAGLAGLIVAGQAFHWFDPQQSKREFTRIAGPHSIVALVWNERLMETVFEKEYEQLIGRFAAEYKTANHRHIADSEIANFFSPAMVRFDRFDNEQHFDLAGLKGRLLSSSYVPKESNAMMAALEVLFGKYAVDGKVRIGYETKLYTGIIG